MKFSLPILGCLCIGVISVFIWQSKQAQAILQPSNSVHSIGSTDSAIGGPVTKVSTPSPINTQLVKHLFNITKIPSPKAVTISKDGTEIWVTSLLNKNLGAAVYNFENKKIA